MGASVAWVLTRHRLAKMMSRAETAFIRLANGPNHSWSVCWPQRHVDREKEEPGLLCV